MRPSKSHQLTSNRSNKFHTYIYYTRVFYTVYACAFQPADQKQVHDTLEGQEGATAKYKRWEETLYSGVVWTVFLKQELLLVTQLFLGGELQVWSSELLLALVYSEAGCWTKEEKLAGATMLLLRICAKVDPLDTQYAPPPRPNIFRLRESKSVSIEKTEARMKQVYQEIPLTDWLI